MKSRYQTLQTNKAHIAGTVIGLLLATLNSTQVQGAVVSDFDDGVPDWNESGLRGVTFSESGGRLVVTGTIPAKTSCVTENMSTVRWAQSLTAREGEVLELRVDLVQATNNDVQVLLQYVALGTGGYALIKDEDEIWLTKFQWVACGANAPFFYQQVPIKNARVRLVLELKKAGTSLQITSKVLDLDAANSVLFERTVTDTAGVDPTVPSFRGYSWSADSGPPVLNGTAVELGVMNVANTNQPNTRLTLDNLAYSLYPVLNVEKAVRLSWPSSFTGLSVVGAPSVQGPWTTITEPVVEFGGNFLMTVPARLSDSFGFFRLE